MAPPTYADLGKAARDLFSKGYNYGTNKLEVKTKTDAGVKFTTKGSHNSETGKMTGELQTEYKCSDYGLTFKETWNTDNTLSTEITIEDQLAKGLKLAFDTSFAPQTGKKNGKVKTGYKQDYINVNCDVDFDFSGPTINGAAVLGYNGFLGGYQMAFDTSKSKLIKSNFAMGYEAGDFTLHTNVNDATEFGGSVHQKVNKDMDVGVSLSWTSGSNVTRFGLASKYTIDKDASINAKVNNSGQVGLGYSQNLRDGVKLTLSSLIEAKNINAGGHKIGMGLEFDL
ncbi:voltage-dependent anion-selective channel protein 2-like [Mercenaria mercenaria]|uniref:voltage-dependent anion-selective channel protein 2-like n=1 Tax=Mercenaria mercenaria TaxID=6596 RepID=UPI00234F5AA2|nr:voltage-dependent anion-selective channel protein 2-like [Mercenaria mercenaria]XP_053392526.1 voltage-dependent anion-selective channel protein 2-like [Mercenaria mercenaria]